MTKRKKKRRKRKKKRKKKKRKREKSKKNNDKNKKEKKNKLNVCPADGFALYKSYPLLQYCILHGHLLVRLVDLYVFV